MTDHLDYDGIRADTVRQVAKLMAAAAITAPKSAGNSSSPVSTCSSRR